MKNKKYSIRIPATTANIGSGFDVLGMSLGLYNTVEFQPVADVDIFETKIQVEGEGFNQIEKGRRNMILNAMAVTANKAGKNICGGVMKLINRIPLARGLGSSSAALASGVFLANHLMGSPFNTMELLNITSNLEGHPDNAAPAILGGFCVSALSNGRVTAERIDIPLSWKAVVVIPDFELLTEKARAVLPLEYERNDVVHNTGALSFLMLAFMYQKPEYLRLGLDDRVHVPYRLSLIPGAKEAIHNALGQGAYGATISGSGPTIIAFTSIDKGDTVGKAMVQGFKERDITARYLILDFDHTGISVTSEMADE